jgi:hypothetical protein
MTTGIVTILMSERCRRTFDGPFIPVAHEFVHAT